MPQPKPKKEPKKVGRPKMAKGEAKGKVVPVRLNRDELKRFTAAAKSSKNLSEWIRSTLNAATQG